MEDLLFNVFTNYGPLAGLYLIVFILSMILIRSLLKLVSKLNECERKGKAMQKQLTNVHLDCHVPETAIADLKKEVEALEKEDNKMSNKLNEMDIKVAGKFNEIDIKLSNLEKAMEKIDRGVTKIINNFVDKAME